MRTYTHIHTCAYGTLIINRQLICHLPFSQLVPINRQSIRTTSHAPLVLRRHMSSLLRNLYLSAQACMCVCVYVLTRFWHLQSTVVSVLNCQLAPPTPLLMRIFLPALMPLFPLVVSLPRCIFRLRLTFPLYFNFLSIYRFIFHLHFLFLVLSHIAHLVVVVYIYICIYFNSHIQAIIHSLTTPSNHKYISPPFFSCK